MKAPLEGKVAIVTGAGSGIGRSHALALAELGATVVVNDIGSQAVSVAQEITSAGGRSLPVQGDVTCFDDMQDMVSGVIDMFERVDILVNNAGILRDRSFAKMTLDDFRHVLDVHLMGSVHATKAVWPHMQAQNGGRIVMTTSSSGLYGNFGQSNYAAAKMALVGLMQTLKHEGAKYDIRVNCLAPTALTAMTEGLLPEEAVAVFAPERVSAGLLALVGPEAPSGMILLAGGGSFEAAHITMTRGIHVEDEAGMAPEVTRRLDEIGRSEGQRIPQQAWEQSRHELAKALDMVKR
ncbi:SDR family NAD(P)-dependent oxidoreductase [bacterium SGD-2]|nr:SDR family NAD(P)-dependent oxidoreductase [bacterium SGD-2]